MTNEMFFEDLSKDIENAKTHKSLKFLTNRLKRFVNESIASPISKAYKNTILKGYKASSKAIKRKAKQLT